jgi:cobalamin-dependent methionine synthase I
MVETLALAAKHKARLVGLTLDDAGLPKTAAQRVEIAKRLGAAARAAGLALSDLFIDPLARAVAVENDQGAAFLDAVEGILAALPGAHVICGLSNISFQMPARPLLNRTFLAMAMARGMDAAILDPLDRAIMATVWPGSAAVARDVWITSVPSARTAGRVGDGLWQKRDSHRIPTARNRGSWTAGKSTGGEMPGSQESGDSPASVMGGWMADAAAPWNEKLGRVPRHQ